MPTEKFRLTGEPIGQTQWRRWRTPNGWHPATPESIKTEFGWLFESGVPMAFPDSPEENHRKLRDLSDDAVSAQGAQRIA